VVQQALQQLVPPPLKLVLVPQSLLLLLQRVHQLSHPGSRRLDP